jgi:Bacterial SH3 domain
VRLASKQEVIQMIRHAPAVAVALCLMSPSWLYAQNATLKVTAASANVHKFPSIGSPVIAQAPRGTVIEVTREIGDWVRISWPEAEGGIAYMHVNGTSMDASYVHRSVGSVAGRCLAPNLNRTRTARPASDPAIARTVPASQQTAVSADHNGGEQQAPPMPTEYITPPSHVVGLGGLMGGSTLGFGATARTWSRNSLGFQFAVSRDSFTGPTTTERFTTTQFSPSVLYALRDRVSDYVWVRPYIGGGAGLHRQTVSPVAAAAGESVSQNRLGIHGFGGGELTFPTVPRFALSADMGYLWVQSPMAGFDDGGVTFSISGHWYVK